MMNMNDNEVVWTVSQIYFDSSIQPPSSRIEDPKQWILLFVMNSKTDFY